MGFLNYLEFSTFPYKDVKQYLVSEVEVKSVLNKHKRDAWFLDDYTINPYQGCSVNCLYCYIRGSKYGENMAERLSAKVNAPEILEKQLRLRTKKNEYGFIVLASATNPYMPIEEKYRLTEKLLHVILKYKFPVHIITKSPLILRDIELLKEIDKNAILPDDLNESLRRGTIISVSISSLDKSVTEMLEPCRTITLAAT